MKILFAGDLHGRIEDVADVDWLAKTLYVDIVIQTGDFGVRWPGEQCRLTKYFADNKAGPVWLSCMGNHDNYNRFFERRKKLEDHKPEFQAVMKEFIRWDSDTLIDDVGVRCALLSRNTYIQLLDESLTGILFCGGAVSSDGHRRAIGKDWWMEEAPNSAELYRFFDLIMERRPTYVVTHDRPKCDLWASDYEPGTNPLSGLPIDMCARNYGHMIESLIYDTFNPVKGWFYGHLHELRLHQISTRSQSLSLHGTGFHGTGVVLCTDDSEPVKWVATKKASRACQNLIREFNEMTPRKDSAISQNTIREWI
jgi:hypothetical protein